MLLMVLSLTGKGKESEKESFKRILENNKAAHCKSFRYTLKVGGVPLV